MQCVSKKSDERWGAEFTCGEQTLFSAFFTRREREKQKPKKGSALRRLGGVGNDIVFFSLAIQITKIINLSDGGFLLLSYLFPSP